MYPYIESKKVFLIFLCAYMTLMKSYSSMMRKSGWGFVYSTIIWCYMSNGIVSSGRIMDWVVFNVFACFTICLSVQIWRLHRVFVSSHMRYNMEKINNIDSNHWESISKLKVISDPIYCNIKSPLLIIITH